MALRRLAELEAKASGRPAAPAPAAPETPAFEREARETLSVTPAELISANPIVRAMTTAARPILAANNLLVRLFGLEGVPLEQLDEMQRRGAQALGYGGLETTGQDVGGAVISPITAAAMKASAVAGAIPRIVQGAELGALAGITSGGEQPLLDAGTGALVGGAIPAAIEGGRAVGTGLSHASDLFRGETGARNILDRYLNRTIGPENVPLVAQQLRAGGAEPLPGYRPTAAEAVAGLPEGSPLVAHQRITASTPGGPSAQFGRRIMDQKTAIQAAYEARNAATTPLRDAAIQQANQMGVQSGNVTSQIDTMLQRPGYRSSEVISKTLNKVKDKITEFTQNGVIDANDLYTIRKELGNTIQTFAKETANWDKRLTAGLERDIQRSIDDAIVKAGGTGWPIYLAEFAKRSQAIEGVKEAAKSAIRPAQRTDLFGGLRIAEETRAHVPQLLSRPMMAANAILRYFSANIEPNIDKLATQRYLNPLQFAEALERLTSAARSRVLDTMQKIGIAPAVQQAIEQQRAAEATPGPAAARAPAATPSSVRDSPR